MHIFIHGLGQTSASWGKTVSLINRLPSHLCPDLSELITGEASSYANLYSAFSGYCKKIRQPFHLCGLSLGSVIALNYALDHPERIKSLVLIAPQYKMPKRLLGIQNIIFRLMPASFFKRMGFQKKEVIMLTSSMSNLDFSGRLNNFSAPALIVCGRKDSANKNAAINLAANWPNARFKFVEGAGHQVNQEDPEALAMLLEEFYLTNGFLLNT